MPGEEQKNNETSTKKETKTIQTQKNRRTEEKDNEALPRDMRHQQDQDDVLWN